MFCRLRGGRKYSGRGGEGIFETMRAVLNLHLESGSYGSETAFRRRIPVGWVSSNQILKFFVRSGVGDVNGNMLGAVGW